MIPLEQIPDRYAGDPQEGLKEIGNLLGPGAWTNTVPVLDGHAWQTHVVVTDIRGRHDLGVAIYSPPDERSPDSASSFDTAKTEAIKRWLHDLTNIVRKYRGEPVLAFDQRHRAKTIAQTLQEARSTPEVLVVTGGQRAGKTAAADAFVARVLARRKATEERDS